MRSAKPASIASISKDTAQVFFASVFVAYLYGDSVNIVLSMAGLSLAAVFWGLYVKIESNYE
jgi:hypothetical protein